jgi:hypothetical protein
MSKNITLKTNIEIILNTKTKEFIDFGTHGEYKTYEKEVCVTLEDLRFDRSKYNVSDVSSVKMPFVTFESCILPFVQNIPYRVNSDNIWYGDMAKFIVDNFL